MAYRILIVDDEHELQNMVKEILTQAGYETDAALSCAQALDRSLPEIHWGTWAAAVSTQSRQSPNGRWLCPCPWRLRPSVRRPPSASGPGADNPHHRYCPIRRQSDWECTVRRTMRTRPAYALRGPQTAQHPAEHRCRKNPIRIEKCVSFHTSFIGQFSHLFF